MFGRSRFRFFEAAAGAASSEEMSDFSSPGHFSLPIDCGRGAHIKIFLLIMKFNIFKEHLLQKIGRYTCLRRLLIA
tara:strand:- start:73 stop:300 length:228 start_codon:yes stop_codon:yes gene_type:complete